MQIYMHSLYQHCKDSVRCYYTPPHPAISNPVRPFTFSTTVLHPSKMAFLGIRYGRVIGDPVEGRSGRWFGRRVRGGGSAVCPRADEELC